MKKLLGTALAVGAAFAGSTALAGNANASVAFNLGVATDYVFRGIDQFGGYGNTEGFGGIDWTSSASHFYLGTWVSNTSTWGAGYDNVEIDLYGGWKPVVGPVTFDLGVIGYGYTDANGTDSSKASNFELKAAASVPFGGATLGAKAYWTPNFGGDLDGDSNNDGWYFEGNAAYSFKNKATVSGAVGYVTAKLVGLGTSDYVTANVGVTYPITDHLAIDGRVIQNSSGVSDFAAYNAKDTKVVGTLTVSF